MSQFEWELEKLLNRYSMENGSDTPDFILAEYLIRCLATFNAVVRSRDLWYKVDDGDIDAPTGLNDG